MRKRLVSLAILLLIPAAPSVVRAQDGFMFGTPKGQLTVRAGPMMYQAGGDLMGFFRSSLTLDRGDFRAPSLQAELAIRIHPRLDLTGGLGYTSVESSSEFRDWVEDDDSPITQVTRLRVIPATVSVRFFPLSRGRTISELAWLPARTTPYVGGGGGIAWFKLRQEGDFVDFEDLSIFGSYFETGGTAATGHVLAGVDHWFSPRIGANLEGRYTFGGGQPDRDFSGYDRLDLSGLQLGLGLTLRW